MNIFNKNYDYLIFMSREHQGKLLQLVNSFSCQRGFAQVL